MAHYAIVDNDGIVTRVVVGKDEVTDGPDWEQYYGGLRTSYNTLGGVHYDPETGEPSEDQSKAFRMNYATIGGTFDPNWGPDGAFIAPKPERGNWTLDPATALWVEVPVSS